MTRKTRIVWRKSPAQLARNIKKYGARALVAVRAAGEYVGVKMQNEARRSAPWENRTGNARSGLFYAVDGFGRPVMRGSVSPKDSEAWAKHFTDDTGPGGSATRLVIVLAHTMGYGATLETGHGGRYAIVLPTIEANIPVLEQMLNGILEK